MLALSEPGRGHVAMLLFSMGIAGSFSLGGLVANEISPVSLNAVRFALASIVVGAAVFSLGMVRKSHAAAPWRYLITGVLMSVYFVLMFEGLKTASAISTSAVFTLAPLISAVFGWIFLRQITTPRMASALAIAACGALWVIFRADWGDLLAFKVGRGETIFFFGCIAHAAYTPLVRKLNRGEPPAVFVLGTLVAGTAVLGIYGWSDVRDTAWQQLPPIVWVTLAYVAVVASAFTFVAVNYATLRLPAAKVMAYTYLTPTWVIAWEWALGQELPRPMILIGVGMTVVALLVLLKDDGHIPRKSN